MYKCIYVNIYISPHTHKPLLKTCESSVFRTIDQHPGANRPRDPVPEGPGTKTIKYVMLSMYGYIYIYTHIHIRFYNYMHINTYVYKHIYIYTHIKYLYIHIYLYISTYTYTYTCPRFCSGILRPTSIS